MPETAVPQDGPEPAMSNHDVLQALLRTAVNANAAAVSRLMLAESTATNHTNSQLLSAMQTLTTGTAEYQNGLGAEGEHNAAQFAGLNTLKSSLGIQENS